MEINATELMNTIKKLSKDEPDLPVKFWTFYEVYADDYGFWLSEFFTAEIGIYAEYNDLIFYDYDELRQAIYDAHDSTELEDYELERIIETELRNIKTEKVINVFLRN